MKEIERIQVEKGRIKEPLFADNVTTYMGTLKIHQRNSYSTKTLGKVLGTKSILITRSLAFLHTVTLFSKDIRRICIEHILSTLDKTQVSVDQGSEQ